MTAPQHHTLVRFMVGYIEPNDYRWPTFGRITSVTPEILTIEDPWNGNAKGNSCIPDGDYELIPHKRPNGDDCYLMHNPKLGVFAYPEMARRAGVNPDTVRTLCIAGHAGSFEEHIEGCFAVGDDLEIMLNAKLNRQQIGIRHSAETLKRWIDILGVGVKGHMLSIRTTSGAKLGSAP